MRRLKVATTCAVRFATVSWIRLLAAAVPPSTAKKALVMATVILLSSKGTTVPLRLMTRNWPGAVADNRVGLGFSRVAAGVDATPSCSIDSLPVCISWAASETPIFLDVLVLFFRKQDSVELFMVFWLNTYMWGFTARETPR
jgi:hypothetical protein